MWSLTSAQSVRLPPAVHTPASVDPSDCRVKLWSYVPGLTPCLPRRVLAIKGRATSLPWLSLSARRPSSPLVLSSLISPPPCPPAFLPSCFSLICVCSSSFTFLRPLFFVFVFSFLLFGSAGRECRVQPPVWFTMYLWNAINADNKRFYC